MAKEKTVYTCTECGGTSPKWLGKCPSCAAWNTMIESVAESSAPTKNRYTSQFQSLVKAAEVTTLADIDATDQLEFPDQNPNAGQYGIQPQLALLESLVYPTASQLASVDAQANSGTLEIAPMLAPLVLFVWGKNRIVPVKVNEFSITEEAFDAVLNPIRAKLSLGLRVMSTDDLGFGSKGGSLYMAYLQNKERLATKVQSASFATLGIGGIA